MKHTLNPHPRSRWVVLGTVVVALLASAQPALAAPDAAARPPPAAVRDTLDAEAKADFDAGAQLFRQGQVREARDAFLAAYARSNEPRVLFNVAVCDKQLGHHAQAIATFKKSLAAADRPLPREYIERTAEALATLRRYVASVTVDTSVEGAVVRVDGEVLRENPTDVDPGSHVIAASKDGFETATTTVTVKAGDTPRVSLALTPSSSPGTAKLVCVGEPSCELRIGDEVIGRGTASVSRTTGSYVVRAFAAGRLWSERRVDITNGVTVDVALIGAPAPLARLRIMTDRFDDVVTIDGVRAGKSGVESELAPGEHRVIIARPSGESKTIDVLLRDNETRDLRVALEEKKGVSPWWFVAGGVVLAGATTAVIVVATRPTTFEGNSAGTLNPYVVTASVRTGVVR